MGEILDEARMWLVATIVVSAPYLSYCCSLTPKASEDQAIRHATVTGGWCELTGPARKHKAAPARL
ncbi:MAG TPA: hypothetical protein VHC22_16895 [Pirellulales bacterium]|nr:hypothetical protein [Pirellulales bacterium]